MNSKLKPLCLKHLRSICADFTLYGHKALLDKASTHPPCAKALTIENVLKLHQRSVFDRASGLTGSLFCGRCHDGHSGNTVDRRRRLVNQWRRFALQRNLEHLVNPANRHDL